jgi:hypothetical protein
MGQTITNNGGILMRTSKFVVSTFCVLASAAVCLAGKSLFFNSLGASAMGPSAAPSTMIAVDTDGIQPGIVVTANTNAFPLHNETAVWIPLNGIPSNTKIKGVKMCYYITTSSPGTTLISRVGLHMLSPQGDGALVIRDDPSVLSNTVSTCHTITAQFPGTRLYGPLILELRVIFGNSNDQIHVGLIELF